MKKSIIRYILEIILALAGLGVLARFAFSTVRQIISPNYASSMPVSATVLISAVVFLVCEGVVALLLGLVIKSEKKSGQVPVTAVICSKLKAKFVVPALVILLVCGFFGVLRSVEDSIVYQQNAFTVSESPENEAGFESVTINLGGESCFGWLYRGGGDTIVYFGGNAETADARMTGLAALYREYNFLMVDYPGYGESEGAPSKEGILELAQKTAVYARENLCDGGRLFFEGYSLGTGPAAYAAGKVDCDGLILIAPYDRMTNVYNTFVPVYHGVVRHLAKNDFAPAEYVKSVKAPVLVIASEDDELIPLKFSQKTAEAAGSNAAVLSGLSHGELPDNRKTLEAIGEFIK